MKGRNCPNCGAPLEADICKCRYCGTSYFDISAINIDDGKPLYLKLRRRAPDGGYDIITAFAYLDSPLNITYKQDTVGYQGYIFEAPTYEIAMNFRIVDHQFGSEPRILTIEHIKGL